MSYSELQGKPSYAHQCAWAGMPQWSNRRWLSRRASVAKPLALLILLSLCTASLRDAQSAFSSDPGVARPHGQLFNKDRPAHLVHISSYSSGEESARRQTVDELDRALRREGVALLALRDVRDAAQTALDFWAWQLSKLMETTPKAEWPQSNVGLLWPDGTEMYSHPHFVAYIEPDGRRHPPALPSIPMHRGSSHPAKLPSELTNLLVGVRRDVLPVFEDMLERGLDLPSGSMAGEMSVVKFVAVGAAAAAAAAVSAAVVHYYPEPTKEETLLTHAAFHSDDSMLTLNFESVAGMHSLHAGAHGGPSIRRLTYPEDADESMCVNLFVGGYLQSLSQGLWKSLIHSGSNPGHSDRVSITLFLGIASLDQLVGAAHGGTRSRQEAAIYELLTAMRQEGCKTAASLKFACVRAMYQVGNDSVQRCKPFSHLLGVGGK
mmetsp:Transcript_183008/g.580003  ORF Transcript_183008/g.580003 Transcript_183008/m.580003 type:complete len:434 (-) Transcript_183008:166-1467(-)